MIFANVKSIIIPEGKVKQIKSGSILIWEKMEEIVVEIKNWLKYATTTDMTTIFGGDYDGDGEPDGYVTGKRLSSSGSEAPLTGMCCSGFIESQPGNILRIKETYPKSGTASYIITYKGTTKVAHKSINQGASEWAEATAAPWMKYSNKILTVTLDSNFGTDFDHIRFSAGTISGNTIVTINQEITS